MSTSQPTEALNIGRTIDISDNVLSVLAAELSEDFNVAMDTRVTVLRSADPPSWIKLVADISWWQAFAAAAGLYAAGLLNEAGKDTWRNRAKIISATINAGSKIKKFSSSIVRLSKKLTNRTDVVLQIPLPHEHFGTRLRLSLSDVPEVVELEVALFVHHLPEIANLISHHSARGFRPITGYFLELRDDASMSVSWADADFTAQERVLPFQAHE